MAHAASKGSMSEGDYPYSANDHSGCQYSSSKASVKSTKSYEMIKKTPEAHMKALDRVPLSVCLDAKLLRNYRSGVIKSKSCYNRVTHAVTMVGYGTAEDGTDYYLCKNSWGRGWGEKGYFRISREQTSDSNGICGIHYHTVAPK